MSVTQESEVRHQIKRAKVSFNLDKEDAESQTENDPIPIVELKPFVHKVWRREKSLPGFYDNKLDINLGRSSPKSVSKSSTGGDTYSDILSQSDMSISPPPRTANSLPARLYPQRVLVYVNTFSDYNSQREHFSRLVAESMYRTKPPRMHPPMDPRSMRHPEHSYNIIPGFITRDDRTKSTLTDITVSDSVRRSVVNITRPIDEPSPQMHQAMRVVGEPLRNDRSGKLSPKATSPARSLASSWQSVRHGSPASQLYHAKPRPAKGLRTKTPLYDHLDREGTLPSLTVTAPALNSRSSVRYGDKDSDDYMEINGAYERIYPRNIGGIENSLKLLSKHGKPTKVEQHLSRELESQLSRLRKSKDISPFEVNPAELAKYYPQNHAFNPTRGELMIRQGLKSNAPKRSKENRRDSKGQLYLGQSAVVATQGILKKGFRDIEHLDSYDREVLDVYKGDAQDNTIDRERNVETGMTGMTDNELIVPNDTPRTGPESQLSLVKTTEELMRERGVAGQSPFDQRPPTEREQTISTVNMNNVDELGGGGLEPQQLGLDKDGRTFITSESGEQNAIVT